MIFIVSVTYHHYLMIIIRDVHKSTLFKYYHLQAVYKLANYNCGSEVYLIPSNQKEPLVANRLL